MKPRWKHKWLICLLVLAVTLGYLSRLNAAAVLPSEAILADWQMHNRTLQKLEIQEQQAADIYDKAMDAGKQAGARWSDMVAMMTQMGIPIEANMKLGTVLSRDIQPAFAELNYEMGLLNNEATRNGLLLTLRSHVYEVAKAMATIQSQETLLSMAQASLAQGEQLYAQGKLAEEALLELGYQINQAEVNLKAAERSLIDKQWNLNSFVGVACDQVYNFELVEPMTTAPLDAVQNYVDVALVERPEMKNILGQLAIKEAEHAAYKRIYDGVNMDDDTEVRYQAVKDDIKRLEIQQQTMTVSIEKEIRSLYLDVKIAQNRMEVQWDQVRSATDTVNQMRANYAEGAVLLTKLTEAENQLATAKVNHQAAVYDYNTLRIKLDFSVAAGSGGVK